MAYVIKNGQLGGPAIGEVLPAGYASPWKLGDIVVGVDPDYGAAEFIYLKGVVGTVAGSWVLYDPEGYTTALLATNAIGPVAVATAAIVADNYGWYQIGGRATANAADVADSARVYIDTVPGRCDDAVVTGQRVRNAKWGSIDDTATGKAIARLARPFVENIKDAT